MYLLTCLRDTIEIFVEHTSLLPKYTSQFLEVFMEAYDLSQETLLFKKVSTIINCQIYLFTCVEKYQLKSSKNDTSLLFQNYFLVA